MLFNLFLQLYFSNCSIIYLFIFIAILFLHKVSESIIFSTVTSKFESYFICIWNISNQVFAMVVPKILKNEIKMTQQSFAKKQMIHIFWFIKKCHKTNKVVTKKFFFLFCCTMCKSWTYPFFRKRLYHWDWLMELRKNYVIIEISKFSK